MKNLLIATLLLAGCSKQLTAPPAAVSAQQAPGGSIEKLSADLKKAETEFAWIQPTMELQRQVSDLKKQIRDLKEEHEHNLKVYEGRIDDLEQRLQAMEARKR